MKDVICPAGDKTSPGTIKCLYADYALFEACREKIDGVIASNPRGQVVLYLNDRSPRYERLRNSRLACAIGAFDPVGLEADGWHFLLEPFVQRPSAEEVKAAITRKYGVDIIQVVNFTRHYAETHVPVVTSQIAMDA